MRAPLAALDDLLAQLQVLRAPQALHDGRVACRLARAAQRALQEGQRGPKRNLRCAHTPQNVNRSNRAVPFSKAHYMHHINEGLACQLCTAQWNPANLCGTDLCCMHIRCMQNAGHENSYSTLAAWAHLPGQQIEGMQGVDAVMLAAEQPRDRLPVCAARRAPAAARPLIPPLQVDLQYRPWAMLRPTNMLLAV